MCSGAISIGRPETAGDGALFKMSLQRVQTSDQTMSLMQDFTDKALQPLQNIPMVGGNLLLGPNPNATTGIFRGISLVSGVDNLIRHGLDHMPTIFFVGNQNVDTRVWSPTTASLSGASADRTYINLRCSTTCVVALWIN
jgi:hypothetical protein